MGERSSGFELVSANGVYDFVRHVQQLAERDFARDGGIKEAIFVFATRDHATLRPLVKPTAVAVCSADTSNLSIDIFLSIGAGFIRRCAAIGVLMMMEAWTVLGPDDDDRIAISGDLADHPRRREVVNLWLEHGAFGRVLQVWDAPIIRSPETGARPKLGAWEHNVSEGGFRLMEAPSPFTDDAEWKGNARQRVDWKAHRRGPLH